VSPRVYTRAQVCALLEIPRRSFYWHLQRGQLPMCEELKPRIGRIVRYRADLVDRYVAGQSAQIRSFASHRKLA
jgi:Helix-turn-helix domain